MQASDEGACCFFCNLLSTSAAFATCICRDGPESSSQRGFKGGLLQHAPFALIDGARHRAPYMPATCGGSTQTHPHLAALGHRSATDANTCILLIIHVRACFLPCMLRSQIFRTVKMSTHFFSGRLALGKKVQHAAAINCQCGCSDSRSEAHLPPALCYEVACLLSVQRRIFQTCHVITLHPRGCQHECIPQFRQ